MRFALISGAGAAALAAPVVLAAEESVDKVERISVTGSRIKRTDLEGSTPVTVLTAKDISDSGLSSISEFLRNTVSVGGFNESDTLKQAAGAASVGLKGFGSTYTLILLNGRRLPKNAVGGVFTDVNQIPMAAVQRIEVLTDSASAIYGSDAIAGVINIITKTDFDGFDFNAKVGAATQHGDGEECHMQLVAGTSTENMNIMFAGEYLTKEAIQFSDREMGKTAYRGGAGGEGRSPYGVPGFVDMYVPKKNADGTDILNDEGVVQYNNPTIPWSDCKDKASNGTCLYDIAPLYQVAPKVNKLSMFTSFNYTPTDDLRLDGQFRYIRMETLSSNGAAPGFTDVSKSPYLEDFIRNDIYKDDPVAAQLVLDSLADPKYAASAENIAAGVGAGVNVGRRYLDFGNREKDNVNDSFEAVMGVDYTLNDMWNTRFDLGYSLSTGRQIGRSGQLLKNDLEDKFNDGTLNPFKINDCSSAELKSVCESLQASIHRTGEFTLLQSSWSISGGFEDILLGGDIGIALGVDYREEEFTDRSDPASVNNQVIGSAGSNGGGNLTNVGLFTEVALPILDNVDLNLAVRQDQADWQLADASELTYSARIGYRPIDELLLRANYGTGFKAPDLDTLFLASSIGVKKGIDTLLCNQQKAAGGSSKDGACVKSDINSRGGGNPLLEPEKSNSWGVGFAYNITDNLSLTVDYWSLELTNVIGQLDLQEILDEEAAGRDIGLVNRFNGKVRGDDRGYVRTNYQNLTEESATGIIYDIDYSNEFSFGALETGLHAEQYLSKVSQSSAVQPLCAYVSTHFDQNMNSSHFYTFRSLR